MQSEQTVSARSMAELAGCRHGERIGERAGSGRIASWLSKRVNDYCRLPIVGAAEASYTLLHAGVAVLLLLRF